MFRVHTEFLEFITSFVILKECVLRINTFLSVAAKGLKKFVDFVSVDEKQATALCCLFRTSDWIAIVINFDQSSYSMLQTMNIWIINIYFGFLDAEKSSPISMRKAISSLEVNLNDYLFESEFTE